MFESVDIVERLKSMFKKYVFLLKLVHIGLAQKDALLL